MVLTSNSISQPPALLAASRAEAAGADTVDRDLPAVLSRLRASVRLMSQGGTQQVVFQAMGTRCSVIMAAHARQAAELTAKVVDWVAAFEAKYSRFLPSSLISRINAAAGRHPVPVDPETEQLLALCHQMHFITGGVFDPSALPLLRVWDWRDAREPRPEAVSAARALVGWRKVERAPGRVFLPEPGMGLDLGGMGKEYAVDRVAQLLAGAGVAGALVDFGGDVRVVGLPGDGRPGWHVGLEDPRQPGRCWCGLGLREGAVATSGEYLRHFEVNGRRYGHILDVRTGWPVQNGCRAASVVAPSCTLAGMLATSCFVLGPDQGFRLLEAQMGAAGALIMDGQTLSSRRFDEYVVSREQVMR